MALEDFKRRKIQIAQETPYDNSDCDLVSEDVKSAIDELCANSQISASPGYAFGREGSHSAGTWLIATESPSNKRGLPFGMNNGSIEKVTVSTENIPAVFTIELYYHDGNLSGQTLIGSVTTTSTTSTEDFLVSWAVPKGHQLAVKISAVGTPKPKETGVFLVVKGQLS